MPDLEAHREGSIGHDARAQNYPDRPITWIVPFTPGGITDNSARVVAKAVGNVLGQPVIVDNRPGAGGSVGVEATLTASRLDVLPNLPTIGELGYPGGVLNSWYGVFAPKGTPPEIIAKTEAAIAKALTDPGVVKHFNNNGEIILGDMSKVKFDTFIDAEMIKWKEIVQKSGATAN